MLFASISPCFQLQKKFLERSKMSSISKVVLLFGQKKILKSCCSLFLTSKFSPGSPGITFPGGFSRGFKVKKPGGGTTRRIITTENMEKINNINIVNPMPAGSPFLHPMRITFNQCGHERFWDFCAIHESVSSIIYNTSRDVLVMVKQFRPAVFYAENVRQFGLPKATESDKDRKLWEEKSNPRLGFTMELCAGIVDKNKSLEVIMQEEIIEECGYKVPLENIEKVISYRSGVGSTGEQNNLYYTVVTDDMKIHAGGGKEEEGEMIEVIEWTIPQVREYIEGDNVISPGGFLFGIHWFLNNKYKK